MLEQHEVLRSLRRGFWMAQGCAVLHISFRGKGAAQEPISLDLVG